MLDHTLARSLSLATGLVLALSSAPAFSAVSPSTTQDRSPDALQARLVEAETNYKTGKVDDAINQAKSLVDVTDSSFLESDKVAREAKADLAVFQLKAGHPDQTAMLMRELLVNLQLELPMDPRYATNAATVLAESPQTLKDYFGSVTKRLNESADTKAIIVSIIDNTVPKDYSAQLKSYCKRLQATNDQLQAFQTIADGEELKYGDSLSSLDAADADSASDPKLSASTLDELGKTLDALATQAQQMPVGDVRAALGLYRVALLANSAQRYKQGETFAQQSIDHVRAVADRLPSIPQVRVALAYALLKQDKKPEFNALKDDLLKCKDDEERLLVTLARFTEASGDDAGAAAIYKRALDNRTKRGTTQPPEWMDSYNTLLKKLPT